MLELVFAQPHAPALFVNLNLKDFEKQPVRTRLRTANCTLFTRPEDPLGRLDATLRDPVE